MSPPPTLAAVVEGQGEVTALPVLVRRIASEIFGVPYVALPPPFRVKRHRMPMAGGLTSAAYVQAARITGTGGVLVVADSDDDCAVALAEKLRHAASPTSVEVAVAVREFEAWFLAGVESLRIHRDMRDDATYDRDPEAPRDAKGVLSDLMLKPYRETLHQPAFAALVDLHQAKRVRSFAHLIGCVGRLASSAR